MFKNYILGFVSLVSATSATMASTASNGPTSFVFLFDKNYAQHCADTIYTLKISMPDVSKNAILIMLEVDPSSRTAFESLRDEKTSIILREIKSIPCLQQFWTQERPKYTTSWSSLILLRCLLASAVDELNQQPDFKKETCDQKQITSFVSLDSDLWVLDDLTELFTIPSEKCILSAPLSPISFANYQELILSGDEEMPPAVSSGVLIWNLGQIENVTAFTARIIENLYEESKIHELYNTDSYCELTEAFLNTPKAVPAIQKFLKENGEKHMLQSTVSGIKNSLDALAGQQIPQIVGIMKKIMDDAIDTNIHTGTIFSTNDLFDHLLDKNIPQANKNTLKEDYQIAREKFPADEAALKPFTDISLNLRFNFNPKDLFPVFSKGNETAKSCASFQEFHLKLMELAQIRNTITSAAQNIAILHFDGTIKPWEPEELQAAAQQDTKIGEFIKLNEKIRTRTVTQEDLAEFRAFLKKTAEDISSQHRNILL